ncbi:MAG: hypothetical protein DHS20C18_47080 [Saprospiraceae bacterium]|nr:MAG: hypothetical protein DHS20C18_47080 [Saprospiraceae bacterium]
MAEYSLVNASSTQIKSIGIEETELTNGILVNLDIAAISSLQKQQPEMVELSFPLPEVGDVQMTLIKNEVLSPDFILRQSSNPEEILDYKPGLYYYGVLKNDPSSLVSISVFDNEIIGMINTSNGNFVIGKIQNRNTQTHIIYNDKDYVGVPDLDCATPDDGIGYKESELTFDPSKNVGDCIRVYIEIDDDIVSNKGGTTGATNYITGLFNEVITLYANESLAMSVSEIKAWNTPAPYSGGSSSAMLSSYQSNTGSFNGDLSHLVSYQASGGIAAGFSGICNSNPDNSKCFSSIDASYSNVPSYSFSVMVCTHEMGHLIGSRHTHACVWNGNNTAIDGCAGATEGSCSLPGSPSGGGTIMSYCHLTTGIDFTQGFGPQPGNVIRNTVANASCLSTCGGPAPTCTDGIQNGQETGVDCGGPSCPPCSSSCDDNAVSVTINLDNYPEETSWQITNSGGSVVASGGTYGSQPDGSTVVENLCLVDGCYDFTIFDAYGDGICCGYGSGSYSVTGPSGTVASGGSFGSSETTNFCFGAVAPTCDDGIQNGNETGVDCGGPDCPACPTGGQIHGAYFETGWDGWSDGGSDVARYSGSRSYEGSYSIRLRDNSGTASAMTSQSFNVSAYSQLEIQFYFYAYSMENGEDFWVRYYNGSSWSTIAAYAAGSSFNNNGFYVATVTLNNGTYNFPTNAQFRFQCDASANSDYIYIDAVTITATSGGLITGEGPVATIEELGSVNHDFSDLAIETNLTSETKVSIYPNPANDMLKFKTQQEIQSIRIVSMAGQTLEVIKSDEMSDQLDISNLEPGIYYLLLEINGEMIPQKFVKM